MHRHVTCPAEAHALVAPLGARRRESAALVYLDGDGRLLALRHIGGRDANRIALHLRSVVADVLATGATGVVLAHNHPSGNPTPSGADAALTRRLARALAAVDVALLDHLVLAGDRWASVVSPSGRSGTA